MFDSGKWLLRDLKIEEKARSAVRVVSSPCEALKFGTDRVWSQQDGLRLV
jgi:hypothetical protein